MFKNTTKIFFKEMTTERTLN